MALPETDRQRLNPTGRSMDGIARFKTVIGSLPNRFKLLSMETTLVRLAVGGKSKAKLHRHRLERNPDQKFQLISIAGHPTHVCCRGEVLREPSRKSDLWRDS